MQRKMADASNIDTGATSSWRDSASARLAAAGSAYSTVSAQTAARRAREKDAKAVKLTVTRGKRHQHAFNTTLGKRVQLIEDGCREQPNLLSRDEMDDEDVEIALSYKVRAALFSCAFLVVSCLCYCVVVW